MIKKTVPHVILSLILFILLLLNVQATEINWKPAQEGNKVIFIRHALAPGGGDPAGFKIDDCSTQRNLNQVGIDQSKRIGELFKKKKFQLIKFCQANGVDVKILPNMLLENLRNFLH